MDKISIYKVFTITHKATDVRNLSQFVLSYNSSDELKAILSSLKFEMKISEVQYLATCNRITFIFTTSQVIDENFIHKFFSVLHIVPPSDLLDTYEGIDAVNHLFKVASSVDSLVIGEREIFRQIRDSYENCHQLSLTGDHLRILNRAIVENTKSIYACTNIGSKPVSVVSVAFNKLSSFIYERPLNIVMIGAGKTHVLVSKFLLKKEIQQLHVYNRTIAKAQLICNTFKSANAYSLNDLGSFQHHNIDVIFICTDAKNPILHTANLASITSSNPIIIDLSVPSNTSDELINKLGERYIDIEKLKEIAEKNLAYRKKEINQVISIIDEKIEEFIQIFKQRQAEKLMLKIPSNVKEVKNKAIDVIFKKEIEGLDEDAKNLVIKMMDYMEKKCISIPMITAKEMIDQLP